MTTAKMGVRIRIESRSAGQATKQTAEGELYLKGEHVYIRYEEKPSELGRTVTLIKLEAGQVKIIRQGDVQADQTFVPGEKRVGFYQTAQGRMELEMETHELTQNMEAGIGTVHWSYDLYASGEHAGHYRIKLNIQKGQGS
ncbi:DUF1934 domain-containing protein [Paenibacillus hexagrammi]|uniref:DUF1934 domain-containing protein n=1 Tax=Paenibacillus hexagrammi TaxID=2908839 RepID=A0ABY3SJD0_9BACL|nr:DUF1934 domain-containing protein [Paenibacillus sp. YPD9-1]UJF33635.1 DUF1934 domain-containing protein [Paenibacillus sp. YPD9-1]